MSELPETASLHASAPELGNEPQRAEPTGPRALFCALAVESEDHVEYLGPAFHFAREMLAAAPLPAVDASTPEALVDGFLAWAEGQRAPFAADDYGSSWPVRVVREFAPVGLTDGVWLSAGLLERAAPVQRGLLGAQLGQRLGADVAHESHALRYGLLLASLGIPLQAITRWEYEETAQCADISYEHGLLGLTLGLFPSWFGPEALGFELWMSAVGPCPLLTDLIDELRLREACVRYLDCYDRSTLAGRARELVCAAMGADRSVATRIARGFAAAQASYLRWERAMIGANVPYTPRDFVLEGVRRKARFAIDHHHDVTLKGHNLAEMLRDGGKAHELLLDHLAETASLVKPGVPDRSPLLTHALSLDGPMFDAFTAAEKNDLREWIAGLGRKTEPSSRAEVPLSGVYLGVADRERQRAALEARYDELQSADLARALAAEDVHPGARFTATKLADAWCAAFETAFATDARLAAHKPPPYTEAALRRLASPLARTARSPEAEAVLSARGFLRGVVDVRRAEFEEYGLLLRRYLAAHPHQEVPRDERWTLLEAGLSRATRRFLPEVLGLNLGFELLLGQTDAEGEVRLALAVRAVRAYFDRVVAAMPDELEQLWGRVYAAARVPAVVAHGSAGERAALVEHWLAHRVDAFVLDALVPAEPARASS